MKGVRFAKELEALLVPLESIKQHPQNPNNGDVDAVIESIQVNGFNTVITVDRETGYITAGNTRYAALHALGATKAPVVFTDTGADGALRFMVADNQTGRLAVMDGHHLAKILHSLQNTELGFAGTGFDHETYTRLLEKLAGEQLPIDTPGGFGHGVAPSGIFQVVVDFRDEDERDDLLAELAERYEGKARAVNL